MQSIWYGRNEKIFNSSEEREILFVYTKKAIDFAEALECKNIVFGCPKNRVGGNNYPEIAYDFFYRLGEYAYMHNTILSIEANPTIYNTDYINKTTDAMELINIVNSKGFKLNLDIGTMIENGEKVEDIKDALGLINHIHISEPFLENIQEREIHVQIINEFSKKYDKYISLEMKNLGSTENLYKVLEYLVNICVL